MSVFALQITLIGKLIPLFFVILLGFVSGRILNVKRESLSPLLVYILTPAVIFGGVSTMDLKPEFLGLPVLFFLIGCMLALGTYHLIKYRIPSPARNIISFSAGSGNTGYFGIPVAISIFGERVLGLVVMMALGVILYENSLGFFLTAKGQHTTSESIIRVIKLPSLYAFLIAILFNVSGTHFPQPVLDVLGHMRGSYSFLGMLMIGLGVSSIRGISFDWSFIGVTFLAKFLAWPLIMATVVAIDMHVFHLFTHEVHLLLMLLAAVPLPANAVVFATELRTEPEKAAVAVILSTLFSLLTIPLIVSLYL